MWSPLLENNFEGRQEWRWDEGDGWRGWWQRTGGSLGLLLESKPKEDGGKLRGGYTVGLEEHILSSVGSKVPATDAC